MSDKNKLQEYCQKNRMPLPIYESQSSGVAHKLKWISNVTVKINNINKTIRGTTGFSSKCSAENHAAAIMLDHIINACKHYKPVNVMSNINEIVGPNIGLIESKNINEIVDPNIGLIESKNINPETGLDLRNSVQINFGSIKDIYMIDLENKPAFNIKCKSDSLYIGFLSSIHHSVKKYKYWHKGKSDNITKEISASNNNKLLYIIDGAVTDLVDHLLTMFMYPLINFIDQYKLLVTIRIISGDHASYCSRACLEKLIKWRDISGIRIKNSAHI